MRVQGDVRTPTVRISWWALLPNGSVEGLVLC